MADKQGRSGERTGEKTEKTTGNKPEKNTEKKADNKPETKPEKKAEKKPERKKKANGARLSRLKLILATLLVLLLIVSGVRVAVFLSSVSKVHLTDEELTHAIRFQNSIVVHGIDVSEHNGEINWKKVKSSEADFAFIRAGFRSAESGELHEDANFKDNMKKAKRAGVMTGAYFYSQALNEAEAIEEADYLLSLVDPYDIDMPLVIDFEFYKGGRLQKAVDEGELPYASLYHDIVLAFCDRVEKAGYESAVYANYNMLTNYMDSTVLDDQATIWAAQYDKSCQVKGDYLYWQCAEDAMLEGVKGPADHDIWYIEPGKVYATRAAGKKDPVSIGECKISFDEAVYGLKNNRAEPKVTVTYGDRKLREGRDYKLSFVHNTKAGMGYAVVRGIRKYKDWTSAAFIIE